MLREREGKQHMNNPTMERVTLWKLEGNDGRPTTKKQQFVTPHLRPLPYNCLKVYLCNSCCDCFGQPSQVFC